MDDVQTVLEWSQRMLVVTAVCVTAFPFLYGLFAPWYRSPAGRAVMLQSMSIAFAIDLSVIGQFWTITTDLNLVLAINIGVLAFVCVTSVYLTVTLVYYNFIKKERNV